MIDPSSRERPRRRRPIDCSQKAHTDVKGASHDGQEGSAAGAGPGVIVVVPPRRTQLVGGGLLTRHKGAVAAGAASIKSRSRLPKSDGGVWAAPWTAPWGFGSIGVDRNRGWLVCDAELESSKGWLSSISQRL